MTTNNTNIGKFVELYSQLNEKNKVSNTINDNIESINKNSSEEQPSAKTEKNEDLGLPIVRYFIRINNDFEFNRADESVTVKGINFKKGEYYMQETIEPIGKKLDNNVYAVLKLDKKIAEKKGFNFGKIKEENIERII